MKDIIILATIPKKELLKQIKEYSVTDNIDLNEIIELINEKINENLNDFIDSAVTNYELKQNTHVYGVD